MEELEYSANVIFVYDYMTIFHMATIYSEEFYGNNDFGEIDDIMIKHANEVIKGQYGFSPIELRCEDIIVEWMSYPNLDMKK